MGVEVCNQPLQQRFTPMVAEVEGMHQAAPLATGQTLRITLCLRRGGCDSRGGNDGFESSKMDFPIEDSSFGVLQRLDFLWWLHSIRHHFPIYSTTPGGKLKDRRLGLHPRARRGRPGGGGGVSLVNHLLRLL